MKLFDAKTLCAALALAEFTIASIVNVEQDFDMAVRLRALLYARQSVDQ
jgi:hypothetical protein